MGHAKNMVSISSSIAVCLLSHYLAAGNFSVIMSHCSLLKRHTRTAISSSLMGHAYDICDWHFNTLLALKLLLLALWGWKFLKSQCSYSASSLFFHFGGGQLLHNVMSLIFCSLMEKLTTRFMTFSCRVCLGASSSVFLSSLVPYEHVPHLVWGRHGESTV